MQQFTGWEYLLIDVANHYGLDKKLFHERIEWAKANLLILESLINDVKPKLRPLYYKACMAIRRAQNHQPMGHLIGFDACCSGIQVMSTLTGDIVGATNTGLVNPDVRADAYDVCTQHMNEELNGFSIPRDDAKKALMTSCYGSSEQPKLIFGEDTPELTAFYVAAEKTAPGAWQLLQELKACWQPYALVHQWRLPDGFLARVRVKEDVEVRIEVDELSHASFTYQFKDYKGTEYGISLPANVTHSVDAYILRCMHRRCNYDYKLTKQALTIIVSVLHARNHFDDGCYEALVDNKMQYYAKLFEQTNIADIVIIPYLTHEKAYQLSTPHLEKLLNIIESMLQHDPFEIVTIHDEFKCHPNNMNHLRQHYINIFAELAESKVLESIMNQITGCNGTYKKLSNNLGQLIRQSNYALS